MLPEQQQRIMGYFIEEAKDHLNTIEQGLLNLQVTIEDADKANEIFRAAHSVKGGAAMLGIESVQKTAHRMEDYFKVLKESTVQVDRSLETMFLRVFDGLKDLIEQLEGPFGLTPEKAQEIMAGVEPVFVQLEAHLKTLVASDVGSVGTSSASTNQADSLGRDAEAIQLIFRQDVAALLRQMLVSFKQPDTSESRKSLQMICLELISLGERFGLSDWCDLIETARIAAANIDRGYRTLAPTLIKEIKSAQDLVLAGRASEIAVSDTMQKLLPEDILATELSANIPDEFVADEHAPDAAIFNESTIDEDSTAPYATQYHTGHTSISDSSISESSAPESSALEAATETQENEAFELNSELFSELSAELPLEISTEQLSTDDLFKEDELSAVEDLFAGDFETEDFESKDFDSGLETNGELDDFETLFSASFEDSGSEVSADEPGLEPSSLDAVASSNDDSSMFLEETNNASATEQSEASSQEPLSRLSLDLDFNEIPSELSMLNRKAESEEKADESLNALLATVNVTGPEVGSEELNNLADLFDGDLEELDNTLGGHAFVSEEMRLNPEGIDVPEQDDLTDLLTQSTSDSSDRTQTEAASADTDEEEDLFGGTLTNGAFATESSLKFDGPVEDDVISLSEDVWAESAQSEAQPEARSEAQSRPERQSSELDQVTDVETLFGIADGLFETAEEEQASYLDRSTSSIEVAEKEAYEKESEIEPDDNLSERLSDREPLTADEITAQGTASSETLSAGLFSSQPVSPSELEIEFPTLTGVKLKKAEEDIDSFFFGNDATERGEQAKQISSQAAVEEGEDLLLEEFGIDSSRDRQISQAVNDFDIAGDLDIDSSDSDSSYSNNSDSDNADSNNSESSNTEPESSIDNFLATDTTEDFQLSDDPWDEISFESDSMAESEGIAEDEQSETDDEALSLDTLSLGLDEVERDLDAAQVDVTEGDIESLFPSAEDTVSIQNADTWSAEETAAGIEVEESTEESAFDLDFGSLDSAAGVDELLPEDLLEFEEAFGKELESTEAIDNSLGTVDSIGIETDELDLAQAGIADFTASEASEASEAEASPAADSSSVSSDASIDDFLGLGSSSDIEEDGEVQTDDEAITDDFDDLESLLSEGTLAAPVPTTDSSTDLFEADGEDDDFGDLERLLKDGSDDHAVPAPTHRSPSKAVQRTPGTREQNMRVPVKHLDNLSNLVGELVVSRNTLERDQERLRQFIDNLLFQVQQLNDVGQRMRDLYERSLLESSLIANRRTYAAANNAAPAKEATKEATKEAEGKEIKADNRHVTGATFDALEMDRFTGFHTLSQEMIELIVRVRESASDIGYTVESSDQVTRQFRQITTQLQEGLNTARMVPFSQASARLPRAIRDISLRCGKEAGLVIEGEETLIDKMIVESLYDPLTHLVNNAITHGIETPEERRAAGKSPEGQITIKAFYQGNQTVIYVADDGRGIDPEFIKRKAIEKRLITQSEADELTDVEAYGLIFQAGFSTRDQADDFAGRGVGMDVVQTALADIRGVITIDSELGRGTGFTIRLPLTLSISKALSCVSNQARIAFPMDGVEDMLDVGRDRILKNDQDQDCVRWREVLLPIRPVTDLLKFNRTLGRGRVYGGSQEDDVLSIIVLRSANTFVAVQVDQVIGEEEIVIKQLEGPVPKPLGIAGATILGDGRVMPIADVLELIDIATGRVRREPVSMLWSEAEATITEPLVKSDPTVLIVDDSITVRELLSMSFNKVGYRVEQARDGQEAWDKLRSGLPCDLVFCDIEMPRMDGLELLSRMQKDSHLKQIPIAMLTSRGADRHRQMAVDLGASGYFTKPYLEEALLDAAQRMLNGELLEKGRGG